MFGSILIYFICEETEIITEEKNYWRRILIEAIEIKNLGENRMNRQVGFEIDDCWKNTHLAKV